MYENLKIYDDEIILPVVNYENYYLVSNYGRVFSLNYRRTRRLEELAYSFLFDKRRKSESMYKRSKMYHINSTTPVFIHVLVARAFIKNDDPDNKKFVNHINGDKSDNRSDNLEWVTGSENQIHAFETGLHKSRKGNNAHRRILEDCQVVEIIEKLKNTYRGQLSVLAMEYGVSIYAISDIKRGKSWKHLPR